MFSPTIFIVLAQFILEELRKYKVSKIGKEFVITGVKRFLMW